MAQVSAIASAASTQGRTAGHRKRASAAGLVALGSLAWLRFRPDRPTVRRQGHNSPLPTVLAEIDPNETQCRSERTVEAWLRELTGTEARSDAWTGGRCRLVRPEIPRDSGGHWCGQATIALRKPAGPQDRPMIEVYFEEPYSSRPGKAYAFRGEVQTPGGLEYTRFSSDFEAVWTERFPPKAGRPDSA